MNRCREKDIRDYIPWWAKILLKIVLSRIKLSYKHWQKLGIFRHGAMDDPEYATRIFTRHITTSGFHESIKSFSMLELGPGDSLASGILAYYAGATRSYLVDVSRDAIENSDRYRELFTYLAEKGYEVPPAEQVSRLESILEYYNIEYLSEGLNSLEALEDKSIDYLWSQSVLEHVRKKDFAAYAKQFHRLLSDKGVSVHGVDLKDHMAYAHNNLRFSESVWESEFMASSGFYTNRILLSEMRDLFEQAGFEVTILNKEKWEQLPTPRSRLHEAFSGLDEEDLLVSDFDLVLKPV